jgi:glycosyltransferase involved in cell wall biosynthesis
MIWYIVDSRMPTEKAYGWQIVCMTRELSKLRPTCLVCPERGNPITEDLESYYSLATPIKQIKLPTINWFVLFNFSRLAYYLNLLSFILKVFGLPISRADVVITRQILLAYVLKILKPKIISVCELHTWPKNGHWLIIKLLKKINLIVVNSEGTADAIKRAGFDQVKVLINAVDIKYFKELPSKDSARARLAINKSEKVAIYVGHLYARKNVEVIVDAARLMPAVKFILIGGSSQELNDFKKTITELPDNVIFLGQIKHQLIGQYLSAADVLLLTNSSFDPESSDYTAPLKLFEYMASQRPIIAADLPSSRAILKDMGEYFVANDAKSLAQTMEKTLASPDLDKLERAYKFSCTNTWADRARCLLKLVDEYGNISHSKK